MSRCDLRTYTTLPIELLFKSRQCLIARLHTYCTCNTWSSVHIHNHAWLAASTTASPQGEQASTSCAVTRISTLTSWGAVGTEDTIWAPKARATAAAGIHCELLLDAICTVVTSKFKCSKEITKLEWRADIEAVTSISCSSNMVITACVSHHDAPSKGTA